jgi:hypothetical protein
VGWLVGWFERREEVLLVHRLVGWGVVVLVLVWVGWLVGWLCVCVCVFFFFLKPNNPNPNPNPNPWDFVFFHTLGGLDLSWL